MRVCGGHYSRIDNHPNCVADGCTKKAARHGGSLESAYCRRHDQDELWRLMDGGMPYFEARARLKDAIPTVRLAFIR